MRFISTLMTVVAGVVTLAVAHVDAASTAQVAKAPAHSRVLLVTYNLFYNHPYLPALEEVLPQWGAASGFEVTSVEGYKKTESCVRGKPCDPGIIDLAFIDRQFLSQFDAIVFSTNGELPLTAEGKQALLDFVQKDGKGVVFLHQSVVTLYQWKPWGELLGAYLGETHMFDASNAAKRPAVMKVEDRAHPATRNLPEHWTLHDEFYHYARAVGVVGLTKFPVPMEFSRERVHVLVSFDSERTDFTGANGMQKGGDYPQVWYQEVGTGRTFYSGIGHREDLWRSDTTFRQMITGGIRWALGLEQ